MASKYKRGKVWYISHTDRRTGRRIRESTGLTDKQSAEVLRRHYDTQEKAFRLTGTPLQKPIRFEDFRKEYELLRINRRSPQTLETDRYALNSFQKTVGNPYMDKITENHLENWYQSLLKSRAVATANTYYRHVRTFFNMAVSKKYLAASPCRIEPAAETESRIRILTQQEVAALLNIMPEAWQNLVKVALYTGARLSELSRIKKNDVDIRAGCVTIRSTNKNPTKTKRFRVIPVPAVSLGLFAGLLSGDGDLLLTTVKGYVWKKDYITHRFTKYARQADIRCTFHDLRKTYGAWLIMNGADLVTVKENMGHSDISVTIRYYVHMLMDHKKEQVNRLPAL